MSGSVLRKPGNAKLGKAGAIASAVFALAMIGAVPQAIMAPAAAQLFSQGYEFLEAVDERDGDVVTEMDAIIAYLQMLGTLVDVDSVKAQEELAQGNSPQAKVSGEAQP